MSRETETEQRAQLRRALMAAGREERAPSSLHTSLLSFAAAETALVASSAVMAPASGTVALGKRSAPSAAPTSSVTSTAGSVVAATNKVAALKLIAVLLALGLSAASVVFASRDRTPAPAPAPPLVGAAAPAAPVSPIAKVESRAMTPNEVASVSVDDLPTVTAVPSGRISATHVSSAPTPTTLNPPRSAAAQLAEETRLVDAIRAAVYAGNASDALHLLDGYEVAFPSGVLAEDAEFLRIESLARTDKKAEALQRVRRFLAERPASPYAARVRTMIVRLSEPE
jgi:hypothetical protein